MSPTIFDRNTKVTVWFGTNVLQDSAFLLDDATLGLLDTGGVLSGDVGTDLASSVYDVHITRGRSREIDTIQAGVCTIRLRNLDRLFDPWNTDGPLLTEDGDPILDVNGNPIWVEGGSELYGNLTPGKRVTVEMYGQVIYDGSTEDWNVTYEPGYRSDAAMVATDALGTLARREFTAHTFSATDTPGERIVTVLASPEVAYGPTRDIDTGLASLQGDSVTWGTNVLNYLQKVAESEPGMLFAARDNTLTFRDRHSRVSAVPSVVFSTEGDGYPIHGLELAVGSDLFYNRVGVDREGGTLQTASDDTSANMYGTRTLSRSGMLMDTDGQALSLAEFLLSQYKEPTARIASIRVNLSALPSTGDRALVAALDLGATVEVTAQPLNTGAVIQQVSVVEGIEHMASHGQPHIMTLRLSPIGNWGAAFTLDDEVLGVLDSSALAF